MRVPLDCFTWWIRERQEIEHFFRVYKDLEGTHTETRGFEGATAARGAIVRAMAAYEERFRKEGKSEGGLKGKSE